MMDSVPPVVYLESTARFVLLPVEIPRRSPLGPGDFFIDRPCYDYGTGG